MDEPHRPSKCKVPEPMDHSLSCSRNTPLPLKYKDFSTRRFLFHGTFLKPSCVIKVLSLHTDIRFLN
eukprot:c25390_g1_i5 orf=47-247(-)